MNTLSGLLFLIAFVPYIVAIVNGQTIPSPVSWALWLIVDSLALLAMKKENSPTGQITGAVVGAGIVTVLSVFYGKSDMGTVELVSLAGAGITILLWKLTGSAVTAIVCSNATIFIASFPEFAIGYHTPEDESPIAWSIWLVSCVCNLLAIRKEKWTLANATQPLTFTTIETIMVYLVVIRPHLLL